MGHNWTLNRTGSGRTKVCTICGINGDSTEDAAEPCMMTPEPRDLTERRVEAIAREFCDDKLGDANAKDVNGQPRWKWFVPLAQRIIAADPATARIAELQKQINELELKWEWELGRRQYWQTEAGKEFERAKSATALLERAAEVLADVRLYFDDDTRPAVAMDALLTELRARAGS